MRKIKDIIRLRQQAGLSQRKIANALRLYVGVVNKYLSDAAAAEPRNAAGVVGAPPARPVRDALQVIVMPVRRDGMQPSIGRIFWGRCSAVVGCRARACSCIAMYPFHVPVRK